MVLDKAAKRLRRYHRSFGRRFAQYYRSLRENGLTPEQAYALSRIVIPFKAPLDKMIEKVGISRSSKEKKEKLRREARQNPENIPLPNLAKQHHSPHHTPWEKHKRRGWKLRGAFRRHPK